MNNKKIFVYNMCWLFCTLFSSCEILEYSQNTENFETACPEILTETCVQIGEDSLIQCPRLEVRDTMLFTMMNDIILTDSMLQGVLNGEKLWYQICFNKVSDTLSIEIIANQYFTYNELCEKYVFGAFYYKDKLFAIKKNVELPFSFFEVTTDTITTNRMYQGTTVYYYRNKGFSYPQYVSVQYNYDGGVLKKEHVFFNEQSIIR